MENSNRAVASLIFGLALHRDMAVPNRRIYYNYSGNCICNKGTSQ